MPWTRLRAPGLDGQRGVSIPAHLGPKNYQMALARGLVVKPKPPITQDMAKAYTSDRKRRFK